MDPKVYLAVEIALNNIEHILKPKIFEDVFVKLPFSFEYYRLN